MNRRKYLRVAGVAAVGSAAGCGSRNSTTGATDELTVPARIGADGFQRPDRKGGWSELLVRGVNMGIAKPGHFPGATAITNSEYARSIERIGEMNANASPSTFFRGCPGKDHVPAVRRPVQEVRTADVYHCIRRNDP